MKMDTAPFREYAKRLQAARDAAVETQRQELERITDRHLARCKKKTAVGISPGFPILRDAWGRSGVMKVSGGLLAEVFNSARHAPYYEYGHRQTPGRIVFIELRPGAELYGRAAQRVKKGKHTGKWGVSVRLKKPFNTLTANAGVPLTGATNGTVTMGDYVKFLSAMELVTVDAIACPTDDVDIRNLFEAFARRMINDEGKYLQAVVPRSSTADFEGVISAQNGVYLENGTHITHVLATAYLAGATARCPLDQSLTNAQYLGAVDVDERYTVAQQTVFACTGQIVFIPSPTVGNKVLIQKDINTLITFTKTRTYALSKNKIIRILFAIAREITNRGMTYYSGKLT